MSELLSCYKKFLQSPNSSSKAATFSENLQYFLRHKSQYNGVSIQFTPADITEAVIGALEITWYSHRYGISTYLSAKTKEAERTIKIYQSKRLYSEVIWDLKRACCLDQSAGIVCNGRPRSSGELNPDPPSNNYIESVFSKSRILPIEKATFIDNKSRSALAYVSMTGNRDALKYVYDIAPYMVYVQDLKSNLPITFAVRFGSLEAVKFLIEQDENLLMVTLEPYCIDLPTLAKNNERYDIAQYLLKQRSRLLRWLDRRDLLLAHRMKLEDRIKDFTSSCLRNTDIVMMIASFM